MSKQNKPALIVFGKRPRQRPHAAWFAAADAAVARWIAQRHGLSTLKTTTKVLNELGNPIAEWQLVSRGEPILPTIRLDTFDQLQALADDARPAGEATKEPTDGTAERRSPETMLAIRRKLAGRRITVGADKAYDTADHVGEAACRQRHAACDAKQWSYQDRQTAQQRIDGRTTHHAGYAMSQSRRAMIECIFGWGKRVVPAKNQASRHSPRRRGLPAQPHCLQSGPHSGNWSLYDGTASRTARNDADFGFKAPTPMDFGRATNPQFQGIVHMYRDLIALRRNLSDETRGLTGQNLNVFHLDDSNKTLAYHRWENGGTATMSL